MMQWVRNILFGPPVMAITANDVDPAPRDPEMETKIKAAQADLAHAMVRHDRRSWEIRQELAGNVLNIVAGNRQ